MNTARDYEIGMIKVIFNQICLWIATGLSFYVLFITTSKYILMLAVCLIFLIQLASYQYVKCYRNLREQYKQFDEEDRFDELDD